MLNLPPPHSPEPPPAIPPASGPDQHPCVDCGMPTTPCTGARGCRHRGRWEWFVVDPRTWALAGAPDGCLCVGCLERRLGLELTAGDFPALAVNAPHPWDSPRLAARKGV